MHGEASSQCGDGHQKPEKKNTHKARRNAIKVRIKQEKKNTRLAFGESVRRYPVYFFFFLFLSLVNGPAANDGRQINKKKPKNGAVVRRSPTSPGRGERVWLNAGRFSPVGRRKQKFQCAPK